MSEFTCGNLFRTKDRPAVMERLAGAAQPYRVHAVDDDWFAILTPGFEPLEPKLQGAPMLYLLNAEDHGWSYVLFNQGEPVATVQVQHGLDHDMAVNLFEERYPDQEPYEDGNSQIIQTLQEEVLGSDAYRQAVDRFFADANVDHFTLVGVPAERIEQLRRLLTPSLLTEYHDSFDQFIKALGIREFSWVSYDYTEDDE